MNRRVVGIIGAAVLAIVGTIVLVTYVNGAEDRALEGQEVVEVLVLTQQVPAGTKAEDITRSVELRKIPRDVVVAGAVATTSQLTGLVASIELQAGEQVSTLRFVPPEQFAPSRSSVKIPDGLVEVTVSLGPEQTIGGIIRPGDKVAVLTSFDASKLGPGEAGNGRISGILGQQVLVTNVQGDPIPTTDANGATLTANDRPAALGSSLLVTLAINPDQMERYVFSREFGRLFLALETKDDKTVPVITQNDTRIFGFDK